MATVGWMFLYAGLLGWVGDYLLFRASWTSTAPRFALWTWHAIAAGVVMSLGWGMVLLAHDVMEHVFAWLFQADKTRLHLAYAPASEVPSYWNATILLLVTGVGVGVVAAVRQARAQRAATDSHDLAVSRSLNVASDSGAFRRVGVCRSSVPLIYCLPAGRAQERIRVTTAALDLLSRDELLAAIEHEQAHIACRHHRQILLTGSVVAVLRWSGLLRRYPRAVRELVEYQADDYAAEKHGVRTVAQALLSMCSAHPASTAPAGASWTGGEPSLRIRRLLAPRRARPRRLAWGLGVGAAILLPLVPCVAAVAPALTVANTKTTPVTSHNEPHPGIDFDHHS